MHSLFHIHAARLILAGLSLRYLISLRRVATREKTISFAIWCSRGQPLHFLSRLYNRQYPYVSLDGDGARKHIRI